MKEILELTHIPTANTTKSIHDFYGKISLVLTFVKLADTTRSYWNSLDGTGQRKFEIRLSIQKQHRQNQLTNVKVTNLKGARRNDS